MKSVLSLLALGLLACALSARGGERPAPTVEDLQKEVERLTALVKKLEAQAEGTAHPVNLGRTALARVRASSVNGGRDMANQFYGVLNAFDDGKNWISNINYTYWLGSGEPDPWIEARFDQPVTVTSIHVSGAGLSSVQVFFAKGGEEVFTPEARVEPDRLKGTDPRKSDPVGLASEPGVQKGGTVVPRSVIPAKPLAGVTGVKLHFQTGRGAGEPGGPGNTIVHEVRVMGFLPAGVEHKDCAPAILMDEGSAELAAKSAFDDWFASLRSHIGSRVEKKEGGYLVTYTGMAGVPLLRVEVSERGAVKSVPLAAFAPAPEGK